VVTVVEKVAMMEVATAAVGMVVARVAEGQAAARVVLQVDERAGGSEVVSVVRTAVAAAAAMVAVAPAVDEAAEVAKAA